jgi:hypothetical protein
VVKYGGRLTDLEKKLDNAYRDAVSPSTERLALDTDCYPSRLLKKPLMTMHSLEMRTKRIMLSSCESRSTTYFSIFIKLHPGAISRKRLARIS